MNWGVGQRQDRGRWSVVEVPDDLTNASVGQPVYVSGVTVWEQYGDRGTATARADYLNGKIPEPEPDEEDKP